MPSKNVGAMSHSATGENEAEDRLPLARTLGIAMVAVLVACDSAAVPLSFGMFGMILNSSSIVPQKPQGTFILSPTLARMPHPPPIAKSAQKVNPL